MPVIKVYHNPNFLDYRGDHSDIVPPIRPVATVDVSEEIPVEQALEVAFRQTQHVSESWWNNPGVMLHVRSSSVGDVLEAYTGHGRSDEEGDLFVAESVGFRTYQPQPIDPFYRLVKAYRQLDATLAQTDTGRIVQAAGRVRNALRLVLEAAKRGANDSEEQNCI